MQNAVICIEPSGTGSMWLVGLSNAIMGVMDQLNPSLASFGWTDEFRQKWEKLALDGTRPARVIADFGTSLKIATPSIVAAELSGRLAHYAGRENIPKVGDWVAATLSDNNNAV